MRRARVVSSVEPGRDRRVTLRFSPLRTVPCRAAVFFARQGTSVPNVSFDFLSARTLESFHVLAECGRCDERRGRRRRAGNGEFLCYERGVEKKGYDEKIDQAARSASAVDAGSSSVRGTNSPFSLTSSNRTATRLETPDSSIVIP